MSEKLIEEIRQIESVEAVAIISFKGNVWQQTETGIPRETIHHIASYLLKMAAANEKKQQKLILAELLWLNRSLLARFSNGFFILVIFRNHEVVSLLRITLNVTVAGLLEEKAFLKWLRKEKSALDIHLKKGQFDEKEVRLISKLV